MNKALTVLVLVLIFLLSGCSVNNQSNHGSETTDNSNSNRNTWVESTTLHTAAEKEEAINIQPTNIEKITFESFGISTEIELSDEVISDIEKSKTAVFPILDELSVSKLGNIYIIENDEKKLFGDVFSDITGTYYLHCIGNPNNAVVELSLKSNN